MIKLITTLNELKNFNVNWNDLNKYCDVFSFKKWLVSWWECYGNEKKLRLYMLFDINNNVKVVLPMMIKEEKGKLILSQICDSCSDFFKIICNPQDSDEAKALIRFALKNEDYDKLIISNLKENDMSTEIILKALVSINKKITIVNREKNYFIKTTGEYDQYFSQKSKNFKHKIKKINKNKYNFHFDIIYYYEEKVIDKIIQIHINKWFDQKQISVFFDEKRKKFLRLVCKKLEKDGLLRIFILKNENEIIAYRLGFIHENIYYDWNTSFNKEYEKSSVGILLCDYVIRYCFENNIKEFDFLRGAEEYKKKFSTGERMLLEVQVDDGTESKELKEVPPQIKLKKVIRKAEGFVFDLDGVVYHGEEPITASIDFINSLLENNKRVGFLTNTSSKATEDICIKLESMGVKNRNYHIVTAATATAEYMKEKKINNCLVYGGDNVLYDEIKRNGIEAFKVSDNVEKVEAVVIGYTKSFGYAELTKISDYLMKGAKLVATDEDKKFAHKGKCLPGTAWILSSIESINNVRATVIGKPSSYSAIDLLKKMDLPAESIIVIGDNIESDIRMAKRVGAYSCLLLGGVSDEKDIAKLKMKDKPDIVVDNLCDLNKYL